MIKCYSCGGGFLKEKLNERELKDCRVRIFNIMYQVFKVIIPTNNFEYNRSDIGAVRDDSYWRNNFLQSDIEDYKHTDRWKTLVESKSTLLNG